MIRRLAGAVLLAVSLVACRGEQYEFREMPIGVDADTKLTSASGSTELLLGDAKEVTLLFFGFTRCPDFCPLTLHKIDGALRGDAQLTGKTRLLFISVDTAHEKPENLKGFLAPYPYARGFTGSKTEIAAVEKKLGAYSKADAGKLSHSLYIYVLNRRGKVVHLLRHDDTAEKIRNVIRQATASDLL